MLITVTLGRLIGTRILVIFLSDFEVDAYPILLFLKYLIYPPDGEEPVLSDRFVGLLKSNPTENLLLQREDESGAQSTHK